MIAALAAYSETYAYNAIGNFVSKLALSEAEGVAELRYRPFGETRWAWGVTPTDRRLVLSAAEGYTGRGRRPSAPTGDYNARMYWPGAGRFVSADSIVPRPGNPQNLNRYAYALNNPLRYTDSSGHCLDDVCGLGSGTGPTTRPSLRAPSVIQQYSLKASIVTRSFILTVKREASRFRLPSALLATTLYAEMNSRWLKDDFEDECVAVVGRCRDGCGWPDSWLAGTGRDFIANDQSFGPAKMKPSAILDARTTVLSLLQAGGGRSH